MRPKASSFGRAHGMPKIHKTYTDIPLFRPIDIVDTTTTPHYNVGKFLSSLLNPLTIDEYHLTDSFEAVSAIKAIIYHKIYSMKVSVLFLLTLSHYLLMCR